MNAITYRLRLLEPVLVSQAHSGEENSAVGLPFVPGSALRGALADRYLHRHPTADPAVAPQFRRLFLDGAVCCLNAYPWRERRRTLPTPLSWFTEKETSDVPGATIYDWAMDPSQHLDHPKAPRGAFCTPVAAPAFASPARQVNVHILLENVVARTDENTVYRYEALAADEMLAGAIVAADTADLAAVRELLEPAELALGGAHLAGYGRGQLEDITDEDDWQEYEPTDSERPLVVTLLSDAIVRGASGQVDGDLSAALAHLLKLPKLAPLRSFHRLGLVGGYNRKWSLPLPQTLAVQAGSVFVYAAGTFAPEALRQVAALSIGERRAEGFGRLAVNWQAQAQLTWRPTKPLLLAEPELSAESRALAQAMAERRLRLLLERGLAETVSAATVERRPQNAQLSRVRTAAQQALAQGSLKPVLDHLVGLKGAREQFEKARLKEVSLLRWIEERATRLDVEMQLLRSRELPAVAGQSAVLTEALKIEYTARLLDGMMKRAIRQNQAAEEGA
jgi:CRISPR-associated protein Csx10